MKITLDIPDGIIAGFFNGVEVTALVRLSGKARLLCSLREANQGERLVRQGHGS